MTGLSFSLASMIAFDVGNRMKYGLTGFDQIYVSYCQSSANVATRNGFVKPKESGTGIARDRAKILVGILFVTNRTKFLPVAAFGRHYK